MEKVASHVNAEMWQEHGCEMIEAVKKRIEEDKELWELFKNCTLIKLPAPNQDRMQAVYAEFCLEVFHARVNKYISASDEMELDKAGKAVKVEQYLRNELKNSVLYS